MRVHQLLAGLAAGDAVGNQALAIHRHLGPESRLLAFDIDRSRLDGTGFDMVGEMVADAAPPPADELVLYHVTIGCGPAIEWLRGRRFGLVYHNITPARFFDDIAPVHAGLAREGRDELARLVPEADVIIADSVYNASEVEALGGRVDLILPPMPTVRRLADLSIDPELDAELQAATNGFFLAVGQFLPHKRPHDLVHAHHIARRYLDAEASLVLAGSRPVAAYAAAVEATVRDLGLASCEIVGRISDEVLATRLRHALAYVTASRHEGFCVPVVEAMAMGVPVIACEAGAVADTAGGAALLLPENAPPSVLAEAMAAVERDADLRAELGQRGLARAAEIEAELHLDRLTDLLARVA